MVYQGKEGIGGVRACIRHIPNYNPRSLIFKCVCARLNRAWYVLDKHWRACQRANPQERKSKYLVWIGMQTMRADHDELSWTHKGSYEFTGDAVWIEVSRMVGHGSSGVGGEDNRPMSGRVDWTGAQAVALALAKSSWWGKNDKREPK